MISIVEKQKLKTYLNVTRASLKHPRSRLICKAKNFAIEKLQVQIKCVSDNREITTYFARYIARAWKIYYRSKSPWRFHGVISGHPISRKTARTSACLEVNAKSRD